MATSLVGILIRWGRVPCINRNSDITGYTVRYSRGGDSTVGVSVSGTGQSERTYTATPLEFNTSYSIQVAAVTSTGVTGPFSTTVTETTSPPRSESVRCYEAKIEDGTYWVAARCATEAFSTTCAVHIEDCEGWWLSACRGSVAEHWRLKPEVSWVRLPAAVGLFHFPLFSPHNI